MNTELQRLIVDTGIVDPIRCDPELAAQWVQAKALLFLAESAERIAAALQEKQKAMADAEAALAAAKGE